MSGFGEDEEMPDLPAPLMDMLGDAQAAMRARSLLDVVEVAMQVKADRRWLAIGQPGNEITDAQAIDTVFDLMELVRQRHRVRHLPPKEGGA